MTIFCFKFDVFFIILPFGIFTARFMYALLCAIREKENSMCVFVIQPTLRLGNFHSETSSSVIK